MGVPHAERVVAAPRTSRQIPPARLLLVGAVVLLLLALPVFVSQVFYLHLLLLILLNAGLALSVNLPARTGYWSIGHAAFIGIGAYTSALATTRLGLPLPLALLLAAAASGVVATAVGRVVLRLRGVYFILVTFSLGEVVRLTFVNQRDTFGGSGGIKGLPTFSLEGVFGLTGQAATIVAFYYVALLVLLVEVALLWAIYRSTIGQALDAIRADSRLAESQGLDTLSYKVFALGLGGVMAGLGGALLVHYLQLVTPPMFNFERSLDLVVMNIVGGAGSMGGALIGALFITPLPELLRAAHAYERVLYGVVLIAVILALPGGLWGLVERAWRRTRRRGTWDVV